MYQFNFQPVFENLDLLLYGAWLTVRLSFLAMILGLVVSLLGAVAKTSGIRPLRWLVDVYVEVIRNTPFLIQIFFIFFALIIHRHLIFVFRGLRARRHLTLCDLTLCRSTTFRFRVDELLHLVICNS